MTIKKSKKPIPEKQQKPKDIGASITTAKLTLRPSVNAAAVITEYGSPFGNQEITALLESLNNSIDEVSDGNLNVCEAMLISQAHALQSIFMNLSRRAIKQEYLKNYETFLKLGLKAQSQCRATLETLAMIKNPPIVFAKQANISQGHQQINNGAMPASEEAATRARKTKSYQNELLESKHE